MKTLLKVFTWLTLSYLACIASLPVNAQAKFPTKPIEMIVPWGPGGGADTLGRLSARWFEVDLKVSVPVINLPGAVGSIGLQKMILNGSEGYSIGVMTTDTLTLAAFPDSNFKFNETVALGVMIRQPSGIFAKYDGPFKSWDEVIAASKEKPGSVDIAITGANTPDEATVDYLKSKGVDLLNVPFTKPSDRYVSVLGGHVQLLYEQAGDVKGFLETKKLRPLLFFATKRLPPPFADIPVSAEFGYDVLLPQTRSIMAKRGADPKALEAMSNSLAKLSATPEFQNFLKEQFAAPDSFIPMREAQKFLDGELLAFKKVKKLDGMK